MLVHAASRHSHMKHSYVFCVLDLMLNFQVKFIENILHQTTVSNTLTGLSKTIVNNKCFFAENLTPSQKYKHFNTPCTCKNATIV